MLAYNSCNVPCPCMKRHDLQALASSLMPLHARQDDLQSCTQDTDRDGPFWKAYCRSSRIMIADFQHMPESQIFSSCVTLPQGLSRTTGGLQKDCCQGHMRQCLHCQHSFVKALPVQAPAVRMQSSDCPRHKWKAYLRAGCWLKSWVPFSNLEGLLKPAALLQPFQAVIGVHGSGNHHGLHTMRVRSATKISARSYQIASDPHGAAQQRLSLNTTLLLTGVADRQAGIFLMISAVPHCNRVPYCCTAASQHQIQQQSRRC